MTKRNPTYWNDWLCTFIDRLDRGTVAYGFGLKLARRLQARKFIIKTVHSRHDFMAMCEDVGLYDDGERDAALWLWDHLSRAKNEHTNDRRRQKRQDARIGKRSWWDDKKR